MAETNETEHPPQTNGLPEENEEDDKSKMRPADIDADMREMERRKRVEMIMSSRLFREELERIIESQMKEGGGPAGLLQQIQDMVGGAGRLHAGAMFKNSNCVVPINDIRGVESMGYAKGEKILRCKLASVFRLMDLYGWTHGINNNITARLSQEEEHFLVNPYGMMFHEVTASSLVKVDMQGNIVESGTTNFGVNAAGFQLHAAVHSARPDIKCIIHIHTPSVLAVSSLKCGLLPVCQESAVIGEISQHAYLGPISEPEEKDKIARNLGPINKVMFLTNYGAVCCGETVEEAFFNVYNTVLACETQVKLMPLGVDNLLLLSEESRKQMYDSARKAPEGVAVLPASGQLPQTIEKKEKRWRIGGMEFEALMRMLDNAGFRTGYIYRTPLVKGEPPRPRNDVEVPPAVSSLGYLLEEEEMYKQGNWKKGFYNKNDRTRWLNSPNVYQKVEILETGTPDPKKITKWVADGSPTHTSTPVKIDAALQFVPKNTNPKEFKKLQQQIKENRRADKITSGPQSHILDEGVSWDEAKKLQDANISMTGDQVIMVGTASKGIIQRGFQHNATVYKTPYAKNPFDYVSDQELEDYKKVVIRKQKGEYYDEDQSESEPLSSSAALPPSGAIKSPPSETEDDSRTEPRVLRIETKTAPIPSQAEVVLSDDDLDDYPSPHVERSKSQRYPQNRVTEKEDMKRSASLERPKTKPVVKDEVGLLVKARIISLEQLLKEKSAYSRILHNNLATCTKSTQTKLRIYIEDNSEDDNIDTVDNVPFKSKPTLNIVPDRIKAINPSKTSPPSKHQLEIARRKSIMGDIHRELTMKLKTNNVFKKRKSVDSTKEEYSSCTVYPLPSKINSKKPFELVTTYDFTSDESADASPESVQVQEKTVIKKDSDGSIASYVGDDYQEGESMSSMDFLSPDSSFKSDLLSINYNNDTVPTMNVTMRKRSKTNFNVDITEIKLLLNDLIEKVVAKLEHSLHDSVLSCSSPTSHSSPIAQLHSDSGYEADNDRTVIHNGTSLFANFNFDYSISNSNEPSPISTCRKINSEEEFQGLKSPSLECNTTVVDCLRREPNTHGAHSPHPNNSSFIHCQSNREHQNCVNSKGNNEFEENNNSTSEQIHFCKPPKFIYLQNSQNQIITFKRVDEEPKIEKSSEKNLINELHSNIEHVSQKDFTTENYNNRECNYDKKGSDSPLSFDSQSSEIKHRTLSANADPFKPLSMSRGIIGKESSQNDKKIIMNPPLRLNNENSIEQNVYDIRLSPIAKSYVPPVDENKTFYSIDEADGSEIFPGNEGISDCKITDRLSPTAEPYIPFTDSTDICNISDKSSEILLSNTGTFDCKITDRLSPTAEPYIPCTDSTEIVNRSDKSSEILLSNAGKSDNKITDKLDHYDFRLSVDSKSYEPVISVGLLEGTSKLATSVCSDSTLPHQSHYSCSNDCHPYKQLAIDNNTCVNYFNTEFVQDNSECCFNDLYEDNIVESDHGVCFNINSSIVCPCLNHRCRDNSAIHPPDLIEYTVNRGEVFVIPKYCPGLILDENINNCSDYTAFEQNRISQESFIFNGEKTFFLPNYSAYEHRLGETYFPNEVLSTQTSTHCHHEESLMQNYHLTGSNGDSLSVISHEYSNNFLYPENEAHYDNEEFTGIPTYEIYQTGYDPVQIYNENIEDIEQTDDETNVDDEEALEDSRYFYKTEFQTNSDSIEDNNSYTESEEADSETGSSSETKTDIELVESICFYPHEYTPLNNYASFNISQVQSVNNHKSYNILPHQMERAEFPTIEYAYTVDYDIQFALNPGSYVEHEAVTSFNSNNYLYTIYENSEVNQY